MKYYLIAGEASGDLHGANLMRALAQQDERANFRYWGGDQMQGVGGTLVKHIRDLAFMGFVEVVANLRTILGNIRYCKEDIQTWSPDVLILIDYPGFNLRIVKWAKQRGLRNFYYISPQIWAWNTKRVHQIGQHVDRMFVILPFEREFYQRFHYEVDYVGHPLIEAIEQQTTAPLPAPILADPRPLIALLPGSRRQEVSRMLRTMASVVARFPDYQFVIAGAPALDTEFYQSLLRHSGLPPDQQPPLVFGQTYALLKRARAALVASGTATLETALFRVPQVVCYRGSAFNYWIFRSLIKVPYISLVNLIMGEKIVEELIQDRFNADELERELGRLLTEEKARELALQYEQLRQKLGDRGASERAAALMWGYLNA
ncbi:MAG: lipid-A-disaccharide synthase [Bacteroidota bacterium]